MNNTRQGIADLVDGRQIPAVFCLLCPCTFCVQIMLRSMTYVLVNRVLFARSLHLLPMCLWCTYLVHPFQTGDHDWYIEILYISNPVSLSWHTLFSHSTVTTTYLFCRVPICRMHSASEMLANLDPTQAKLMSEECIVVDEMDRVLDKATKQECHLMANINKGKFFRWRVEVSLSFFVY